MAFIVHGQLKWEIRNLFNKGGKIVDILFYKGLKCQTSIPIDDLNPQNFLLYTLYVFKMIIWSADRHCQHCIPDLQCLELISIYKGIFFQTSKVWNTFLNALISFTKGAEDALLKHLSFCNMA